MPITLTVDPAIQAACPDLRLGHLLARVQMGPSPDLLWEAAAPELAAKAPSAPMKSGRCLPWRRPGRPTRPWARIPAATGSQPRPCTDA